MKVRLVMDGEENEEDFWNYCGACYGVNDPQHVVKSCY